MLAAARVMALKPGLVARSGDRSSCLRLPQDPRVRSRGEGPDGLDPAVRLTRGEAPLTGDTSRPVLGSEELRLRSWATARLVWSPARRTTTCRNLDFDGDEELQGGSYLSGTAEKVPRLCRTCGCTGHRDGHGDRKCFCDGCWQICTCSTRYLSARGCWLRARSLPAAAQSQKGP